MDGNNFRDGECPRDGSHLWYHDHHGDCYNTQNGEPLGKDDCPTFVYHPMDSNHQMYGDHPIGWCGW